MMAVARARLFLDDDHDDVPLAPPAAPPAPYGAPPPPPPQVEEEGEEAEQQDEAADEAAAAAAAPSFSCLALWNWRPNRLRSPARARHRRLSRHRAARSLACSSAEAVGCAASREVSLGTRPRKEFAWLDLEDQRESVRKGCGCALCSALQAQEGIAEPGLAEQALVYCCVYAEIR